MPDSIRIALAERCSSKMSLFKYIASSIVGALIFIITVWLFLIFIYPDTDTEDAIGILLIAAVVGLFCGIILARKLTSRS